MKHSINYKLFKLINYFILIGFSVVFYTVCEQSIYII